MTCLLDLQARALDRLLWPEVRRGLLTVRQAVALSLALAERLDPRAMIVGGTNDTLLN